MWGYWNMDCYDEPPVSLEQQRDYDLLVGLSDAMYNNLKESRESIIEILNSEQCLKAEKSRMVREYVNTRISFEKQIIAFNGKSYTGEELVALAEKLYNDKYFYGNESEYVINGLAYYDNSITFVDLIIAFHNYILNNEEVDLWWLSLLLCRYIYHTLTMDSTIKNISFDCEESITELSKLAQYIVDFWSEYLRDADVEKCTFEDDKKLNFYDRIDRDAGWAFASEDVLDEKNKSQINAEHAAELASRCSKSIYLLLSTLDELNDKKIPELRKSLRRTISDICDTIYDANRDILGELKKDERLEPESIRYRDEKSENAVLKLTIQVALEKLRKSDTGNMLVQRNESLLKVESVNSEELTEEFVKEFSKLLMNSIPEDMGPYYDRVSHEIGDKYTLLPKEALDALVSAEYLYDLFVKRKAPEGFDYSGIAVLYFQAFETTYDKLVIESYSNWLRNEKIDSLFHEKFEISKIQYKKRTEEEKNKLEKIQAKLNIYFSKQFDYDFFYSRGSLVTSLEIGKFQRFIDLSGNIDDKENKLVYFLENFCFGKPINKRAIEEFAKAVNNAVLPRNEAAHGLHGLKEEDAKRDKLMIYDETDIKNIREFKNLLYALLEFFK